MLKQLIINPWQTSRIDSKHYFNSCFVSSRVADRRDKTILAQCMGDFIIGSQYLASQYIIIVYCHKKFRMRISRWRINIIACILRDAYLTIFSCFIYYDFWIFGFAEILKRFSNRLRSLKDNDISNVDRFLPIVPMCCHNSL